MKADTEKTPFAPGTRVAIISGSCRETVKEAFVDKVYKNGNFTVRGDKDRQQWRPSSHRSYTDDGFANRWSAYRTGRNTLWDRQVMYLWDKITEKRIEAINAKTYRRTSLDAIHTAVNRLHIDTITDEQIKELKKALKI